MSSSVDVFHQAILVVLRVGGPILLLCMAVGIVVAILQAVTQIHEQSIAFVMKAMVVIGFMFFGGGWMMQNLVEFTQLIYGLIATS